MTEDQLQAECITLTKNYFPFLHGLIWHVPNQVGTRSAVEAKKLQAMGVEPGVWDIHVLLKSRLCIIEMKVGNNKLSQLQSKWEKRVTDEGALTYGVCYDVAEYKRALWHALVDAGYVKGWRNEVTRIQHIAAGDYVMVTLEYSYEDWLKFNKFDKRAPTPFKN